MLIPGMIAVAACFSTGAWRLLLLDIPYRECGCLVQIHTAPTAASHDGCQLNGNNKRTGILSTKAVASASHATYLERVAEQAAKVKQSCKSPVSSQSLSSVLFSGTLLF
jgi:hypothetical protein